MSLKLTCLHWTELLDGSCMFSNPHFKIVIALKLDIATKKPYFPEHNINQI